VGPPKDMPEDMPNGMVEDRQWTGTAVRKLDKEKSTS